MKCASVSLIRLVMLTLLILGAHPSTALHAQEAFALPEAKAGFAYEFQIQTEGGLPPLKWRVAGGELPPGIELLPSGTLRGVPTTARGAAYEFVIELSDSSHPPQTFAQRFSLLVKAAPLRMVLAPGQPKIVPSAKTETPPVASSDDEKVTPVSAGEQGQASVHRGPQWVVPLQPVGPAFAFPAPAKASASSAAGKKKSSEFNPATFIRIYEDTKAGNRLRIYNPQQPPSERTLQMNADENSTIVIEPVPDLMGEDLPLNKLYMAAELASGDSTKPLEVKGYAVVGQNKATMGAQAGMAFQSAENVEAMMLNVFYTVYDIIHYVYGPEEVKLQSKQVRQIDEAIAKENETGEHLRRLKERFRLYQPEVSAIADFFAKPENLAIVEKIGTELFWIDRASMQRIAEQYKENIRVAFDDKSTQEAKNNALRDLFERTKLVYEDLRDLRREVYEQLLKDHPNFKTLPGEEKQELWQVAIQKYKESQRPKLFGELKKLFATGSISLASNKAKDGDRLTLTVEAVAADGSASGIPAVFEIAIKKYGAKIQWSPSFLFVRRLGVTDSEVNPPAGSNAAPLNRINFAPSPGMTFGIAYFKRGSSGGDKFLRALGPGFGLNVTFMNFNDPSFDLATSKFVNTTGTNVQVGAGLIGSLFDNKIQFSYGWNLNVERRRTYFGVGFGFIEIGKELTKYLSK